MGHAEDSFRILLGVFFSLFMLCLIIPACRYHLRKKQRRAAFVERYGTAENQQLDNKRRIWRLFGLELPDNRSGNQASAQNGDALPDYQAVVHGRDGGELVPRRHWGQMDERILEREIEREREAELRNMSGDLESGNMYKESRSLHLQTPTSDTFGTIPPNTGHLHISVPSRSLTGPSRGIYAHRRYASDPILVSHYGSVHTVLDSSRGSRTFPTEAVPPPKYSDT